MKKIITATFTGAAAALLVAAPSGAASAAGLSADKYCLVQAGEETKCASTEAGMKAMAGAVALEHALTVFEHPDFRGAGAELWVPGGCDAESDFNPPDHSNPIPELNGTRRWVSSVDKIEATHCNWVLVGPNGGRSTEVEGDWPRLGQLGDGWDNRAVRILTD